MNIPLYTSTMEVVPLLLIALFLDNRNVESIPPRPVGRWYRLPDMTFTVLGITAFTTSMFVVAGVIVASRFTLAIVVTALSGAISLLSTQIWRRFEREGPRPSDSRREPIPS
jgi:hypothetical protein